MNKTLSTGAVCCLLFASGCKSPSKEPVVESLLLRSGERAVQVLAKDELFARVVLTKGEPVSIEALFAPGGRHVLRGFPMNPRDGESVDHPEHQSMWTAHGSVAGEDLWRDQSGGRLTGHALRMRPDSAAVVDVNLDWRSGSNALLCDEKRSYAFQANDLFRTVDVEHVLTAPGGGVVFGDVREGFFALRLDDAFRLDVTSRPGVDEGSAEVMSSLKVPGQDLFGIPARWVAYTAPVADALGDKQEVTVAVFDHPDNYGYPTRWYARPYGLVAANPFAEIAFVGAGPDADLEGPNGLRIEPYGSLTLRYRVLVSKEGLDRETIEALWKEYTADAGD